MPPASNADLVTTERLLLRRPLLGDLAVFHEIHADPEANRFNRIGLHRTTQQSRAVLDAWLAHWLKHGFGPWVVEVRSAPGDPAVGFAGLRWRGSEELPGLNLYFRLRPAAWGHGYATEAALATVRFALADLGAPEVTAIIHPENAPSIRVAERAGMTLVGPVEYRGHPSLLYIARAADRTA